MGMARATSIFIFLCMGVIAASVTAIMLFQFARPAGEAISLGLALMCAMVVSHLVFTRQRERSEVTRKVAELEERVLEVDEDIGNLEGRLTGMESNLPRRTREEIDPLFAEVEVLGSLIKQMAEAMAGMEERIDEQDSRQLEPPPPPERYARYEETPRALGYAQPAAPRQPFPPPPQRRAPADPAPAAAPSFREPRPPMHDERDRFHDERDRIPVNHAPAREPEAPPVRPVSPQDSAFHRGDEASFGGNGAGNEDVAVRPGRAAASRSQSADPEMRALIQEALDASRVDLYLQPLVTLPQRQVREYEALTRIRDRSDDVLEPVDFIDEATRAHLMPAIDNLMLLRSIQVLRRLSSRNRKSGLFVNLSVQTLADERFFPGFLDFLRANEGFAGMMTFEFSQADVAEMGALEHESLAALFELGYRFSIDRVDDLRMDFKALSERGFRFLKLRAARLLGSERMHASHIHPADLGDLLRRYAMELIVDHVETEAQVLELLDLDVRIAQGYLFSPPRPVRPEVLQSAGGRAGAPARGPTRRAAE